MHGRNTPTENGGIGAVKYALAADVKHEIAKAYGIEHPEEGCCTTWFHS